MEELYLILQSRVNNVWLLNGERKNVAFYSVYENYIELYLVNPERLAAGIKVFKLYEKCIPIMIKDFHHTAFDGNLKLYALEWVW